ncbi:hypothetical protein [Anabaena azotica]|uniref:hypothetical protein n=1 Tax=Anabaena azotica TaxID=197653 RepID=UPI0039A4869C
MSTSPAPINSTLRSHAAVTLLSPNAPAFSIFKVSQATKSTPLTVTNSTKVPAKHRLLSK